MLGTSTRAHSLLTLMILTTTFLLQRKLHVLFSFTFGQRIIRNFINFFSLLLNNKPIACVTQLIGIKGVGIHKLTLLIFQQAFLLHFPYFSTFYEAVIFSTKDPRMKCLQ